jgi:hypothetical protein
VEQRSEINGVPIVWSELFCRECNNVAEPTLYSGAKIGSSIGSLPPFFNYLDSFRVTNHYEEPIVKDLMPVTEIEQNRTEQK